MPRISSAGARMGSASLAVTASRAGSASLAIVAIPPRSTGIASGPASVADPLVRSRQRGSVAQRREGVLRPAIGRAGLERAGLHGGEGLVDLRLGVRSELARRIVERRDTDAV